MTGGHSRYGTWMNAPRQRKCVHCGALVGSLSDKTLHESTCLGEKPDQPSPIPPRKSKPRLRRCHRCQKMIPSYDLYIHLKNCGKDEVHHEKTE